MKLLTFLGHGHTGHTVLAAIFDSHPNVAISNTYGAINIAAIVAAAKEPNWSSRYPFDLPGQGQWKDLKVVGHTTLNDLHELNCEPVRVGCFRSPIHVIESRYHKMKNRVDDPLRDALKYYVQGYAYMAEEADVVVTLEKWSTKPKPVLKKLCGLLEIDMYTPWFENAVSLIKPIEPVTELSPDIPWEDITKEEMRGFEATLACLGS
jgi:hypothetical protein